LGKKRVLIALWLLTPLLQGCVASVVQSVVTAPIKIVSKSADLLTTSQSESDEKRGKHIRMREENLGKLARKSDKARRKCVDGDDKACSENAALEAEIAAEKDRVL
jgi:hypothetical protein